MAQDPQDNHLTTSMHTVVAGTASKQDEDIGVKEKETEPHLYKS